MALGGRSIVVAVGSQFMVAPNHRGLGIKLLRTFLAGPQHLSLTDGHGAAELVVDHLFYHAWRKGALAVSGRLQADFFEALKAKRCIFHGGGAPLLVYSRQHDLIEAVRAGDAFLTRLDGEWWMPFQRPARARASA